MLKKNSLLAFGTGLVAISCISGSALAQEAVSLGTSSSGSDPYVNGSIIARAVNENQDQYKVSIQTTGGYKDNLGLVLSDSIDIGMNSLIELENAYNGRDEFAAGPTEQFKELRKLFIFGVVPHNFFVRADSGITELSEIKGKRINLNTPASFTYNLNLSLLEAAGLSEDDFEATTVSTGKVFDEMQNRIIDGGLHVYQSGLGNAQQLASTTDTRWISFDQNLIEKLNAEYENLLVPYTIPAGVYPGQDEDVQTFGIAQVLLTDADADEEMIYQFTKAFWEDLEQVVGENPSFQGLTLETGARETTVPFHPGAERYFREKGMLSAD